MEWKIFFTVFASIFVAEMADKTQLATLLFASNSQTSKLVIFAAASLALVAASAIAVTVGAALSQVISTRTMTLLAGFGFILVGLWTLWQGWLSA